MTQPTPFRREGPQLAAALVAAERGWHVFPLRPGDKRPALHGEGACPLIGDCAGGHRKWEDRATIDSDRIRHAWADRPFNIGIATGPSGLLVVDLDVPKRNSSTDTPSGVTTFTALCERAGQPVPTTYRTRTASGGHHLYFTTPPGARLGNTAGTLAPLVDTRAWGGYVVAAGSSTPGGRYEVIDPAPVAPLPGWLLTLLQPAPRQPVGPLAVPVVSGSRAGRAALERECRRVVAAPEKQGNNTLNRSAFKVGRFVAWGDLARHEVEEAFQGAGEARGLTAAECRATIRSALDSSIRTARPRETA
ncbi:MULTISPECIES: bifunctional DNA primase/polymerase [Streptomyces]|uniref:bifunctional DNA primase/polymerase n=1 Tax=Streptomyces TaxID=1883 RepID=UPI00103D0037|nr:MULTISPECIES: bifunctional DNA primase/polymerase [Streptomyces]MBT3076586.1 bifunctional DNA primase/polymerase [Streptomyces sp. COG21]MBT3078898.1 bifunctional DNA primase/polymerase [Streptomyces sp. COG20]MBT3087769.1 bifunctional DNA primase/polymerase [Streptomyces sp. CYG21]MBT3096528.1 bifunctional DNA primase/polymerase [Streptomyces sp. CBG30]MBT3107234.1 bifunctional DNA primase/polymerase [Streptomyces sp. COG19]